MKRILLAAVLVMTALCMFSCAEQIKKPDDTSAQDTPDTKIENYYEDGDGMRELCLSKWTYRADTNGLGIDSKWFAKKTYIGWEDTSFPNSYAYTRYLWFSTTFDGNLAVNDGDRILIDFYGMPYYTKYWLNGEYVGEHINKFDGFTFDVTDFYKPDGENYLCVYSENPSSSNNFGDFTYQGIGLSYTVSPRVQKPAYVRVVPGVYSENEIITTDIKSGEMTAVLSLKNELGAESKIRIFGKLYSPDGNVIDDSVQTVEVGPGESEVTVKLSASSPLLWSPETPNLYSFEYRIVNENGGDHSSAIKFGYRSFRVNEDGFFELNGEPYYIKGTMITGNNIGGTVDNGKDAGRYYDFIVKLKSMGINCLRYLDSVPIPEVLDACDRVGMMVYSEHPMSWHKYDDGDQRVADNFAECAIAALKTVQSHPCVTIFGFQNETDTPNYQGHANGLIYEKIKNAPEWAREYAPDIMFLLSSGRFDGNRSLGSASNPGSKTWDGFMGNESADANSDLIPAHVSNDISRDMGDIHYYPLLPYGSTVKDKYKSLDGFSKGVLVSEFGSGSVANLISDLLDYESRGISVPSNIKEQDTDFKLFYSDYKLDTIFPSVEAVYEASSKAAAESRELVITYIRRVGNINGIFISGAVEYDYNGEGLIEMNGDIKDGLFEPLSRSLADLRFCITTDKAVYYKGEKINLDVVLSDLSSTLKSGEKYSAKIAIRGKAGTVWSKNTSFIASDGFAAEVFNSEIEIGFGSGDYTISVEIAGGGHPYCTTKGIQVVDKSEMKGLSGKTVYVYKVDKPVSDLLGSFGAKIIEYSFGDKIGNSTLLVGMTLISDQDFDTVQNAAKNGANVVFLNKGTVVSGGKVRIDIPKKGKTGTYQNWFYHFDCAVYENSMTEGLHSGCIMDSDYYSDVYSYDYFTDCTVPDQLGVSIFYTGTSLSNTSLISGFQLGTYKYGNGSFTLNALKLTDNVGSPVADTIIYNLAVGD